CRSIELYLFFSACFITVGRWEKRGKRKFFAVRLCQAPIEDGLHIGLVQIARGKFSFYFFYNVIIKKAHNTSPLSHQNGAEFQTSSVYRLPPQKARAGRRFSDFFCPIAQAAPPVNNPAKRPQPPLTEGPPWASRSSRGV